MPRMEIGTAAIIITAIMVVIIVITVIRIMVITVIGIIIPIENITIMMDPLPIRHYRKQKI